MKKTLVLVSLLLAMSFAVLGDIGEGIFEESSVPVLPEGVLKLESSGAYAFLVRQSKLSDDECKSACQYFNFTKFNNADKFFETRGGNVGTLCKCWN